jgi:hypothetical protein
MSKKNISPNHSEVRWGKFKLYCADTYLLLHNASSTLQTFIGNFWSTIVFHGNPKLLIKSASDMLPQSPIFVWSINTWPLGARLAQSFSTSVMSFTLQQSRCVHHEWRLDIKSMLHKNVVACHSIQWWSQIADHKLLIKIIIKMSLTWIAR